MTERHIHKPQLIDDTLGAQDIHNGENKGTKKINRGREKMRRFTINPQSAENTSRDAYNRVQETSQPANKFTPIEIVLGKNGKKTFKERESLDDTRITDTIVESLMPSERFALALLYGSNYENKIPAENILSFMKKNKVKMKYEEIDGLVISMNETLTTQGLEVKAFKKETEKYNSYFLDICAN